MGISGDTERKCSRKRTNKLWSKATTLMSEICVAPAAAEVINQSGAVGF